MKVSSFRGTFFEMHDLLMALSEHRGRDTRARQTGLKTDVEGMVEKFFPEERSSVVVSAGFDVLFRGGDWKRGGSDDREALFLSHIGEIGARAAEGEKMDQVRSIL